MIKMKIFINPGHHPGVDPGAVNERYGVTEADIVLDIGKKVEKLLQKAGHETYLLQSNNLDGEDPRYQNICRTANQWNAALFVSIHCNSFDRPSAKGTEVLIYRRWSRAEGLAAYIQNSIVAKMGTVDRGVKERPYLAVLQGTAMPAVLVETAFISNEKDVQLLMVKQDDFAGAIAQGILEWIGKQG